ncbi:MAG: glycosyltransferase family 2 protein [Planctomycetes bacterium]|nr:glycosyltransferase family 2 protein [Planctomycetota bacterium]
MAISVIIPTYNEELHLERCIRSVIGWCEKIHIVDSYSSDRTPEIAAKYADQGVTFVQRKYEGPSDQKNWALDNCDIPEGWVLFLDTDEFVPPEQRDEMLKVTSDANNPTAGYMCGLKIVWYGKWIRWGGWYPNPKLRLVRTGKARFDPRLVHEHLKVDGPIEMLKTDLVHEDLRDLAHYINKHNRYSDAEAIEYKRAVEGEKDDFAKLFTFNGLRRRRWIKTRLWAKLPGKMLLYFIWAYFFRLGFLDGRIGLRFHMMHAMFKNFDELKLWELRFFKEGAPKGAINVKPQYCDRFEKDLHPAAKKKA